MALDSFANEARIILADRWVERVKKYTARMGLLTQPSSFSVELGSSVEVRNLIAKYPPNTPFQLEVAGQILFRGNTDGWGVPNDEGTGLTLMGRDTLAPLHDAYVTVDKTFEGISIYDLVMWSLEQVYGVGRFNLAGSNASNRKALSNSKKKKTTNKAAGLTPQTTGGGGPVVPVAAQNLEDFDKSIFTASATSPSKKVQAKIGMRHYNDLLKPQLDRAGLFLWAAGDGTYFILCEARVRQKPLYLLRHRRGVLGNEVVGRQFQNNTSMRYSRVEVWGRRGGGKEKRGKVTGSFVDQEMVDWGIDRPKVISDDKCTSEEQATFRARREVGEARRAGWNLTYTTSVHTLPDPTDAAIRSIIIPDTVVILDDDEVGLFGPHYIESVEYSGAPHFSTTFRVMREGDVVFGAAEGEGEAA